MNKVNGGEEGEKENVNTENGWNKTTKGGQVWEEKKVQEDKYDDDDAKYEQEVELPEPENAVFDF